ncbi:AraC family transcriptional regulator [Konateibacter massiliensis]|uniref:AraC family transcriptional regulator n=1 Tax=Konateibacter massiliensis TaxID=2002841 RepID=UPI0015D47A2E|nr:AraC family transcriptional regulator [Konateibacter massiliensis]
MEKVFYLLERIYKMTHIPIYYMDKTGDITLFGAGYEALDNPLSCDDILRKKIMEKLQFNSNPILEFEESILYGACKDTMENMIVLGPVTTTSLSPLILKRYVHQHNIKNNEFHIITKTINELSASLAALFFLITRKYINEMDIITNASISLDNTSPSTYQDYVLTSSEEDVTRFNFSVEMDFMKQIRNGDLDFVKSQMNRNLASFQEDRVGKLSQKSFKQNEYMACTAIILASRAAIDGGLDSLTSYLMSDLYFQQLENCKEISEIYRLVQDVIFRYTERVKQVKEEKSSLSYVEQCKTYIYKHLNKRFTIDDIANEININSSYLSRKFSAAEGMGIAQYAQKKRIEAAANMLKFSDESILTISNYLCFATQSHFGRVFKEHMGVTPRVYREENMLIDFKPVGKRIF